MSSPLPAFYGRNAILKYGTTLQLEVDTYRLSISAPLVDTTNISVYEGKVDWPYDQARTNPLIPTMTDLAGTKRRYMEFGTPGQVTFGGLRRGKVSLNGICNVQEHTPHIGNFARLLLTHDSSFGTFGVITIYVIVSDFSIEQQVKDYMRWTMEAETNGDFDITPV